LSGSLYGPANLKLDEEKSKQVGFWLTQRVLACSVLDPANSNWMKKSKNPDGLSHQNWFWPSIFAPFSFLRLVHNRRTAKPKHSATREKSAAIYKKRGLIAAPSISDWSIIIISPGALLVLVVVSHPDLFAVSILVLWVESWKKKVK